MLHPSYMELIDHINKVNNEMGNEKINSRYSLVMAASKRARALIDKENPMIVDKYNGRMLSMAIAYSLQIIGQKYVEPTPASLIMSLESVFAVLFGWLLLNETLAPHELLGCALVFVAVILSQIPVKTKNHA